MRIVAAVAMVMIGTGAWAGAPQQQVTVCVNPGTDGVILGLGLATAGDIIAQARVKLNWRLKETVCAHGGGIVVTIVRKTPPVEHPGALAYALPFERARIVVFLDRVLEMAGAGVTPYLLGHVLAHEVVHILRRSDAHSSDGLMKMRWAAPDYARMQTGRLRLTDDDIQMIHAGLADPAPPAWGGR